MSDTGWYHAWLAMGTIAGAACLFGIWAVHEGIGVLQLHHLMAWALICGVCIGGALRAKEDIRKGKR